MEHAVDGHPRPHLKQHASTFRLQATRENELAVTYCGNIDSRAITFWLTVLRDTPFCCTSGRGATKVLHCGDVGESVEACSGAMHERVHTAVAAASGGVRPALSLHGSSLLT